jgi:hypothetical protein
MSLIKKIDVEEHFAARRAMRLGRTGPLSKSGARMQPAATAKSAPASIQAGATGHSSTGTSVASVSIAADLDGQSVPAVPRSRQA